MAGVYEREQKKDKSRAGERPSSERSQQAGRCATVCPTLSSQHAAAASTRLVYVSRGLAKRTARPFLGPPQVILCVRRGSRHSWWIRVSYERTRRQLSVSYGGGLWAVCAE